MTTTLTHSATAASRTTVLNILLVEDDAEDALILRRLLAKRGGAPVEVKHCTTLGALQEALELKSYDVVLLDLGLPDGDGLTELPRLLGSGTPVLVLTGLDDGEVGIEAVRRGAQDYLPKHELSAGMLWRSLHHAIERQRLRKALLVAHERQQALKDEVLSHVSHELRTPLTAVYAFVGILRDGIAGELAPKQQEYLAIIERNVGQLKRMIGDLMDMARINNGKLVIDVGLVDVKACVADVLEAAGSAAAEKGIELEADLGGSLPPVLGDSARTTQVLQNLVDNAVKFTQRSGRVLVKVDADESRVLRIAVQDNGCGIAPELLTRLFERLQQEERNAAESRAGLGLGLWISRELVLSLGGTLEVESTLGEGSTFTLSLPIYTLDSLIAQVLGRDHGNALSLIHVELQNKSGGATGCSLDTARREAVRSVERCLVASTDTLIPEAIGTGPVVHVFALARANQTGAAVISRRVHGELSSPTNRLERSGFGVEVKIVPLVTEDAVANDLARIAACVREYLDARR